MTNEPLQRPIPVPDEASKPFFDGARSQRLMVQHCQACKAYHMPVRSICDVCLGTDLEWVQSSGKGEVYTFVLMHYIYHPAFAKEVPYNLATVKLKEGVLMDASLVDCRNEEILIGMPVEVVFEAVSDEVTVPKFRPATRN